MSPYRPLLLALAAAAGASHLQPVAAQSGLCFPDDGLSGQCCALAPLAQPAFPAVIVPGIAPEWTSCQPVSPPQVEVRLTPPVATPRCGQFEAQLEVVEVASGNLVLGGTLVLDYTRTFGESTDAVPDPEYQVWRFAAKADLAGLSAFISAPTCVGTAPAFYYGYVDYARSCAGPWEGALVLYHGCDRFVHDPALSAVPGAFHLDKTYGVIAPHTAANPFQLQNLPPIGGPAKDEGLRTVPSPGAMCVTEERTSSANLQPFGRGCGCAAVPGARQQSVARFVGTGSCPDAGGVPSSFDSLNVAPSGLPWLRMVTTSLGHWTTAASYPGPEEAAVSEGCFLYRESCASGGAGATFVDLFYGATTARGFDLALPPAEPQPDGMIDLASNFAHPFGAPAVGPFIGRVLATRHLIYANVY